ncbi:uncharacterized protein LOC134819002 [Bolinopsis microptera]|uniref:uncharacterized protein LOC134819002 n=1 Tax=Bolinopsis microptera TaxID=2820187 RepID=UPI00307A7895
MTTFNTNVTSGLGARTTIGPTKIRSPTRYSDMFVGAQNDVIESMLEGNHQESAKTQKKAAPAKNLTRYERLTKLRNNNRDIQTIPDVHYRVVESIPDAMDAALELANYHSVSVLWEGFDVNRHGVLTWIVCGYLGSAVLFNIRKFGAKIFTEGGLKRLLEARHPIKVIHDCSCLADILFNQYDVELRAGSIFDTHAADLLIQSKTSQELTAKTLTECLIEYQDIPVSVYRQRESILRRDPSIWVWENIPPELLLVTARIARYAVLLHGIMLRELSKPLPQITEIYLNCRIQENSPDPKTRIRQIPPGVESMLIGSKQIPILKTEWNIPESILNPAYESQPGDEHFYSKPFKFDPKKATPGSLRIFSVNPNRPVIEDDNDWEKYVHGAPNYGPAEEEEELERTTESKEGSIGDMFKVPDIFSDVTSSSAGCEGDAVVTSRDFVTSRNIEHVTDDDQIWSSNSSSDDNVNFIIPECEPPPTVAATMDPSRLGSRTIFAGDPRYNDPAHKAPVMSPKLSKLVEKIRAEQKSEPRSRAFITSEEMRRNLEEERSAFSNRYTPDPDRESHNSSEVARITEKTENLVKLIEPHYEIVSSSSSSSDVIVEQGEGFNAIPQCFIKKPFNSALLTSPRQPFHMSSLRFQTPMNAARAINSSDIIENLSFHDQSPHLCRRLCPLRWCNCLQKNHLVSLTPCLQLRHAGHKTQFVIQECLLSQYPHPIKAGVCPKVCAIITVQKNWKIIHPKNQP